jgi:pimeloyl-ACP methyl ester carboxylesterase
MVFCLLHGKWHDGSCWDALAERLRSGGHQVVAPDLPYNDPETVDGVIGAADAVVVVGHSLAAGYAPLVADAVSGSSLVYPCPAPVGPFAKAGAPVASARQGFTFPPNRADGTSVWQPEAAIAAMYPRLPLEKARSLAERLRPGASPSDSYPLSSQPEAPTTFIYATYDEFFDPAWSRWVAQECVGVDPIEVETGHFAMVEAPDAVADILLAYAR